MSTGPFLRRGRIRARAVDLIATHDTAPLPDHAHPVLRAATAKGPPGREVSSNPKLIVAASPTRGLDVGAIETVRSMLAAAADDGVGVLLLSEDLDEVLSRSDRIAVIYEGRIGGRRRPRDADVNELGFLMGGGRVDELAGRSA